MRTLRAGLFRCLLASTFLLIVCAYTSQLLAARISLPVPRITLYPGDTIRADHLVDRAFRADPGRQHPVYRSRGYRRKNCPADITSNGPIPINALRAPHLVVQGTVVQIVFREGSLEIWGMP